MVSMTTYENYKEEVCLLEIGDRPNVSRKTIAVHAWVANGPYQPDARARGPAASCDGLGQRPSLARRVSINQHRGRVVRNS